MTTDERNFRSTYYEKVGCRSVEEKKSLEILLKERPINRMKLKQFCLRFTVPAVHRNLLWNILLGVHPIYLDNYEYVMAQKNAVYEDLSHALKIMGIVDDKTAKSKVFHAMWLLENKKLQIGININTDTPFITITEILLQIFENDSETYWIAKGFYEFTSEIEKECQILIDSTYELLQKEDSTMYNHLQKINVLTLLPLQNWYTTCFASIIAEPAIIRIWDKIIGGSRKILVFVSIFLFSTFRRQILHSTDLKSILQVLNNVQDDQETADLLVNKAIELWQQNKGHSEFVIHRKDNCQ